MCLLPSEWTRERKEKMQYLRISFFIWRLSWLAFCVCQGVGENITSRDSNEKRKACLGISAVHISGKDWCHHWPTIAAQWEGIKGVRNPPPDTLSLKFPITRSCPWSCLSLLEIPPLEKRLVAIQMIYECYVAYSWTAKFLWPVLSLRDMKLSPHFN